jgi:ubiquinone/menaquinone biosynthesis C-methylase UbiE
VPVRSDTSAVTTPQETYAHGHSAAVLRSHGWRTAENSAGYLLPHLRPADRLLDVGVGPGTITLDLARRLREGSVEGIDNAPLAVEAARRNAAATGAARVSFALGDVYALDFPDAGFDVVHAHQVLQHLTDPVSALREMRRVTRPGGLVACRDADYSTMAWYPQSPGLDRWLQLYLQVARSGGGEPNAGRRLKSWAQAAGFAELTCSASVWCFAEPGDLRWWTETWGERVTSSSLADQAIELGLSSRSELAEIAAAWRAWGSADDGWFSVVHGEVIAKA